MNTTIGNRPPRSRVRSVIVAAAALALLASGCSAESDDEVPSALTSADPGGEKENPSDPIEFSSKPLWSKEPLRPVGKNRPGFETARVLGDKVAYVRENEESDSLLAVAKAATGKTAWKLAHGETIKGSDGLRADYPGVDPLGATADATALLVGYLKTTTLADGSAGEENGIAALSLKDGDMLWHVPVATGPEHDYNLWVRATSESHVAVELSGPAEETDSDSLVMVDYDKREVAWKKKWAEPAAIIDDTVIVDKVKPDGDGADQVSVMGLKVSSGKKRWELKHDKTPEVLHTTSDAVLASVGGSVLVLDPKSGSKRAKLAIAATVCVSDGESTLACQSLGGRSGAPDSAISLVELTDTSAKATPIGGTDKHKLTKIYNGRIFTERITADEDNLVMLDTSGKTIAEQLPGRLIDITGTYAVFALSDGVGTEVMTVHKVAK